jgi:hypothetical protein
MTSSAPMIDRIAAALKKRCCVFAKSTFKTPKTSRIPVNSLKSDYVSLDELNIPEATVRMNEDVSLAAINTTC